MLPAKREFASEVAAVAPEDYDLLQRCGPLPKATLMFKLFLYAEWLTRSFASLHFTLHLLLCNTS